MSYTRRTLLTSIASAAATRSALWAQHTARHPTWQPKLGILCQFSQANLDYARQEGFTSVGLWADPKTSLSPETLTDEQVEHVKEAIHSSGLHCSVLGCQQSHIDADAGVRERANAYFAKVIDLAGHLGVPYVGTGSGNLPGRPLQEQVDEIVRVYHEKYFPVCEKHNIRILWEPWAGGRNIATGPVGYEALFRAFGETPYVGLQYDPSHLVWQMMDPIQCARDFADKIYDVHLKDTEIRWHILRKTGIHPLNDARWWRFRLPGQGSIDWKAFFTVLEEKGYQGAMNIEHEDELYHPSYNSHDIGDGYKTGFRVTHQYLKQFVPA